MKQVVNKITCLKKKEYIQNPFWLYMFSYQVHLFTLSHMKFSLNWKETQPLHFNNYSTSRRIELLPKHRILRITTLSVTTPHAEQRAVGSTECVIGAAWSLVGFLLCPDLLRLIKDILRSSIMPGQLVITRGLIQLPRNPINTYKTHVEWSGLFCELHA